MKHLLFLIALFATATAHSQCSEFDNLLKKGDNYLKASRPNYQEAINAYTAAILACSGRAGEAKQRITRMVNEINKLKESAVAAEKKATEALKQVEKEKAATEEQRQSAQQATKDAQAERDKAQTALANLKKANADVVRLILENADRDILNLRYEDALQKIKAAASLGALKTEVAKVYLEITFWHGETGNFHRASELLDSIADFTKSTTVTAALLQTMPADTSTTRNRLREVMRLVDPDYFKFLFEQKYYPDMVFIQGGKFMMGCEDAVFQDDEILHEQEMSSFHIARKETTIWQFALYCAAERKDIHDFLEPAWSDLGDNPAVNVNWFDAALYLNWVNKQLGLDTFYIMGDKPRGTFGDYYDVALNPNAKKGYRLPTEAEWEYAAKGGYRPDKTKYSGNIDLDAVGWFNKNSGSRTRAVGKKQANGLGLYDMSGNVWEWCWDWYEDYKMDTEKDYMGPESGSSRVVRGGGWHNDPVDCRVAFRIGNTPADRSIFIGFRLVFVP